MGPSTLKMSVTLVLRAGSGSSGQVCMKARPPADTETQLRKYSRSDITGKFGKRGSDSGFPGRTKAGMSVHLTRCHPGQPFVPVTGGRAPRARRPFRTDPSCVAPAPPAVISEQPAASGQDGSRSPHR
ncbi:hypothetical protein E5288_WYG018743 [Bos mutus]|uniref:Uncharacterized protein n=1 Tax=Bos mutus TaxID=72004 RepID=A0A6B0QZ56_9CETA|nr:hypothetical protein [Bos mutus]